MCMDCFILLIVNSDLKINWHRDSKRDRVFRDSLKRGTISSEMDFMVSFFHFTYRLAENSRTFRFLWKFVSSLTYICRSDTSLKERFQRCQRQSCFALTDPSCLSQFSCTMSHHYWIRVFFCRPLLSVCRSKNYEIEINAPPRKHE